MTFPRSLDETPTSTSVPGDGKFLYYEEGLFIGHRWYNDRDVAPLLPFGHGLSYTSFEIGEPVPSTGDGERTTVMVPVTNTGARSGTCVVQLYLDPGLDGRPRVLAGFQAVELDAGHRAELHIELADGARQAWNSERDEWEPLGGNHRLEIGTSATEILHVLEF